MGEIRNIFRRKLSPEKKPFLQPLALIIVCLIFITLILAVGLMDLARLDNTLVGFMQSRGVDLIGNIQRSAQGNFSNLIQLHGDNLADTISPFTEETFQPQKVLISSLMSLSRHIDKTWDSPQGREDREKIHAREGLWLLAVTDENGGMAYASRRVPASILNRAGPVIRGKKEIIIDLFQRSGKDKVGFIAAKRTAGAGAVILALDDHGFRFWSARIAVQKAIDEAGGGKGVAYISILNNAGVILGTAGEPPDLKEGSPSAADGNPQVTSRKLSLEGRDILEIEGPISLEGAVIGTARIGLERDRTDEIVRENRFHMFMSMLSVMLLGLISILILFHNQNRHLARIEEMSRRLRQSERLSSLGKLAAGVAHEIRNPLNAISIASQRLQREYLPEDKGRREDFLRKTGVIRDEIRRLNDIVEEFLNFSRRDKLELRDYPVEEILRKLVSLVEEEANVKGITIRKEWSRSASPVPMDVDKFQQALLNILKNAMESITGEGTITVAVGRPENGTVGIRISDTGAGLPPEEIERIFNPEYTTKEKGLGLGLPIAHEIIRGHGGEIRVESRVGSGTTFEIRLPAKDRS